MTISHARRAAFEILRRVEQEHAYASVLLASLDTRMREDDRALSHELVLGVLRNQLWLDRVIEHLAERDVGRIDLPVKLALRLALYQLRFLSRIPPSAAVNESVKLVRAAGLKSAAGFVNAVLRRATRDPDYDPTLNTATKVEKLAVETSHPHWLIEKWIAVMGFEETAALVRANNQPAPLCFRFTANAISRADDLLRQLQSSGVRLSSSQIVPNAWRLSRVNDLVRKYLRDGLIYLQDEASQLVAHLIGMNSGDRLLDVCAAPGSKATQIAALASRVMVVAGDLYEHRLHTMKQLADGQGATVYLVAYDASATLPFADQSFDLVLIDAPCSGTGTLRHNPEIRWRIGPSDVAELSRKQRRILANAAALVKFSGRLVYSTCSLEREENEEVVSSFLQEHSDFQTAPFKDFRESRTKIAEIRTWPHRDDTDGFFIAAFERRSSSPMS